MGLLAYLSRPYFSVTPIFLLYHIIQNYMHNNQAHFETIVPALQLESFIEAFIVGCLTFRCDDVKTWKFLELICVNISCLKRSAELLKIVQFYVFSFSHRPMPPPSS